MKHRHFGEGVRAAFWTAIGAALIYVILLALLPRVVAARPADDKMLSEPTVKITVGAGHGSGVYIGDGYAVTAAHVVESARETIWVISATGKKRSGTVVFLDTIHDIAILRLSLSADIDVARLACRIAVTGEEITIRGSPGPLDFISTWGRVSGAARTIDRYWLSVYPVNVVIVGGDSGGPMFDASGAVLGIVAGVGLYKGSPFIGLVIPSTVVCGALGYLRLSRSE